MSKNSIGAARRQGRDTPTMSQQVEGWAKQKIDLNPDVSRPRLVDAIAAEHPDINKNTIELAVNGMGLGVAARAPKQFSAGEMDAFRAYARPYRRGGMTNLQIANQYVTEGHSERPAGSLEKVL